MRFSTELQGITCFIVERDSPGLSIGKKEDIWINTSNKIKEIKLGNIDVHDFRIRDDLFLISVKKM